MPGAAPFREMIEESLLSLHTGYIAKVISVSGDTAKVQPLNMVKSITGKVEKLPPIDNVPILKGARKFEEQTFSTGTGGDPAHSHSYTKWVPVKPQAGDIVFCMCADRDISETKTGKFATPVIGRHMLGSSVLVGII